MQEVISELERLRRRSRSMLILQRGSVLLAWILGVLLGLILIDFLFRLPSAVRLVLLVGGVGALIYGLWSYLRAALAFAPSLTQIALRVERVMPSVAGRLASSVEFAVGGVDQDNQLAARSVRETQTRLAGESVGTVINSRQTWRNVGIMLLLAAVAIGLGITNPASAQTGLTRLLMPYSDAKWPARTGVESLMDNVLVNGQVYPRGLAMPLRAKATRGPEDQTVSAYIRYQIDNQWHPWQHKVLTHQAQGLHESLVDTNAQAIELYFMTDDDETGSQVVELVPPPMVRRASLTVTPPAYANGRIPVMQAELGQGLDDRAVTDTASLIGSTVGLRLELNKPLPPPSEEQRASWITQTFGWGEGSLPEFSVDENDPAFWNLRWQLAGTQALALHLTDEHGLSNAEPIAYRIEAVEDRIPAVTITQPQADEVVLPTAVVSLTSEARDDVALVSIGLQAHIQEGNISMDEALAKPAYWDHSQPADNATAAVTTDLDIGALNVSEGNVVLVTGTAQDVFELNGTRHELARSPVRRLRVINELDFATQLRRQLSAVRQNAIRLEALQGELQDDVIDDGVQPGMDRAQAQIGERIAGQRESVEDIQRALQQNRLEDQQLEDLLSQTQDLLDHAGRSANKAVETIEKLSKSNPAKPASAGAQEQSQSGQQSGQQQAGQQGAQQQNPQQSQNSQQQQQQQQQQQAGDSQQPQQPSDPEEDFSEVPQENRDVVDAQQEVRDELADLIKLLDRDEDTWVVKRQLEDLLEQQKELEQATGKLGQQTIGKKPEDLTEAQRSELDKITQRQRDLKEQARKLIEQMRERAEALEKLDPQAAESMRSAADTAEQQQLDKDMEDAAQKAEQNQMTSATAKQQQAQSTMQQMLNDIAESKRAQAQQLIRQLASLIESIERLISVQENEIIALATAADTRNFSGLDRSMIRLNQNTQSVAGEARSAGQEARRIARALDRAADTQGAAVFALRSNPVNDVEAKDAEERSLALLKEAKQLAEELQQQTQEDQIRKRREELIAEYRKFAEQQVALRAETLKLQGIAELDRRQLVEARRQGAAQDDIRTGLNQLRDVTSEIMDSIIFVHAHRMIDAWSAAVTESLAAGKIDVDATDRQLQIAEAISHLIKALEESMAPPPEFAQDQQQQENQGQSGQQGQQPLIPPVAQLKLLQGLQEQVYNQTKDIDSRTDLDEPQQRTRLRELGQQQRELMDLGEQMLEELQRDQPGNVETPEVPELPPDPNQPEQPEQPEGSPDEPAPAPDPS